MLGYTIRRVLLAVFVLWGVVTVVFIIVRMVPSHLAQSHRRHGRDTPNRSMSSCPLTGDSTNRSSCSTSATSGERLTGDFGNSDTQGVPAMELVAQVLPNTALLAVLACALALIVSFPLGLLAALRVNRPSDRAVPDPA